MIPFNVPPYIGVEKDYVLSAIDSHKICGDGEFTSKCNHWIEEKLNTQKVLLTTSCTHALEMSAILCDIQPGDEVIMPSYTFCSTADAFVMRGAKIVFVDIRPDTMNIDEKLIENAITKKTKVIVPVHYAGVACEMDSIIEIARRYDIKVVEDAAQAIFSTYNGMSLGTIGDFGALSFHETKNYSMGEGGAIILSNEKYSELAEVIREKGTNRAKFFRGEIDKYTWVNFGSSYLPSELNAAYLYGQLINYKKIFDYRMNIWNRYFNLLHDINDIELPFVPKNCEHNAHMFYIKAKDLQERTALIKFLKENEIISVFHYIPLHSSPAGIKYGKFSGKDIYTTKESERLLRLPLYYGLEEDKVEYICAVIHKFYNKK